MGGEIMSRIIPFSIGDRKIEVMLQKIGKSPVKTLTELITNSDDSYKRLVYCTSCKKYFPEKEYRNKSCPRCGNSLSDVSGEIIIVYYLKDKNFQVIDHAEGLTDDEMEEKFNEFGEDVPGRTAQTLERGLFKQGLAQVLFTQEYGNVRSIKNKQSFICKYIKQRKRGMSKKKRGFHISAGPRVTNELKKAWRIPEGNGTLVEFKLHKDMRKPNADKLYEKLCNFFMLRKILFDPKRDVKLIVISSNGKPIEKKLKSSEPRGGKLLDSFSTEMKYADYPPIKIEAEIYDNLTPLVQYEKGMEDREGGLLVFDDKDRVYDLTLFKFDKWQDCRNLYGNIKLYGAYEIIKDRLDEYYEEVVLESREGFNAKHEFYKILSDVIESHLEPSILKIRKERKADKDTLSTESKRRQERAFKILNKLYEDLTETMIDTGGPGKKDTPPKNGIEFARSNIKTTIGKQYLIQLRIDSNVIPLGSEVLLKSSNSQINVNPTNFNVVKEKDEIISKLIKITGKKALEVGTVSAETGDKKAELIVEVLKEEYHEPQGAMEFIPDHYYFVSGRKSYLNLYVDTSQIPIENIIQFESDNPNLVLEHSDIKLEEEHRIYKNIARVRVPIIGHGINQEGKIEATCFNLSIFAKVKIVSKIDTPPKRGGKFSGEWHYRELDREIRADYDAATGDILINSNHPVNKKYFGRYAKKAYEKYLHCQIYLAELILDECLNIAIGESYNDGKLKLRLDPPTDIKNYIEENRFKIGREIHKFFVKTEFLEQAVS